MAMNEINLGELFDKLWKTEEFLEKTDEPTPSDNVQAKVKDATEWGELAIGRVNMLDLFSTNEDIDEVATNEIRYMLLPALLGYFTMKSTKQERQSILDKSKLYFTDYLKLCKDYGLTDVKLPNTEDERESPDEKKLSNVHQSGQKKDTSALERERNSKIARYKEQKATESRLSELYPLVKQEHVDEETKREYYLALVKKWIIRSIEELEMIDSEVQILQHMAKLKTGGKDGKEKAATANSQSKQPRRPFIITKDKLQKEVFGLGYPSIPTYSLDEFYDRQVELGNVPKSGQAIPSTHSKDEEDEKRKEENEENDDEASLKKAREWDEWKDDHRRGWGNTYNKG